MALMSSSSAGGLTSNKGIAGGKQPFLVVRRKAAYNPTTLANTSGLPVNSTYKLKDITGFVRVKGIHLHGIPAESAEIDMLESLLKEGVYI